MWFHEENLRSRLWHPKRFKAQEKSGQKKSGRKKGDKNFEKDIKIQEDAQNLTSLGGFYKNANFQKYWPSSSLTI